MLSTFLKEFEKLLFEIMIICKVNSQSILQSCKNHNTQHALLVIIEKWKTILNKKLEVGTLFMNLSQALIT